MYLGKVFYFLIISFCNQYVFIHKGSLCEWDCDQIPITRDIIGDRKGVFNRAGNGIGISIQEFSIGTIIEPTGEELQKYSENPRNAYGDWYEDYVRDLLTPDCSKMGWILRDKKQVLTSFKGYKSPIYDSTKSPDFTVENLNVGRILGLELKYLKGTGSLVKPKALVDAIDFTNRPIDCIYVIDGPGWHKGNYVDYLARWWNFTDSKNLVSTLTDYFE